MNTLVNANQLDMEHDIVKSMNITLDDTKLSNTVNKIKQSDINGVKTIGSDIQQKISTAVVSITQRCKTLDAGAAGTALVELNSATDISLNPSWLEKRFFGAKRAYKTFVAKYSKASTNLETVVEKVDGYKEQLEESFEDLYKLVEISKQSFDELEYYVEAFKTCAVEQDIKVKTIPADSLESLGEQQKLQVYRRRLDTLQASRVVLYQTVKEAMLLMITNRALIDDMQYTVDNIVPLWQAQIITATNAEIQKRAVMVNKAVRESFNKMLIENAKRISENAVEIMNDSNSSIISPETLEQVGSELNNLTARLKENFTKTTVQYNDSIKRLENLLKDGNSTAQN